MIDTQLPQSEEYENKYFEMVHETDQVASKAKILKETHKAISFEVFFTKPSLKQESEIKVRTEKSIWYIRNIKKRNMFASQKVVLNLSN